MHIHVADVAFSIVSRKAEDTRQGLHGPQFTAVLPLQCQRSCHFQENIFPSLKKYNYSDVKIYFVKPVRYWKYF